jgi:hypothetical protein
MLMFRTKGGVEHLQQASRQGAPDCHRAQTLARRA